VALRAIAVRAITPIGPRAGMCIALAGMPAHRISEMMATPIGRLFALFRRKLRGDFRSHFHDFRFDRRIRRLGASKSLIQSRLIKRRSSEKRQHFAPRRIGITLQLIELFVMTIDDTLNLIGFFRRQMAEEFGGQKLAHLRPFRLLVRLLLLRRRPLRQKPVLLMRNKAEHCGGDNTREQKVHAKRDDQGDIGMRRSRLAHLTASISKVFVEIHNRGRIRDQRLIGIGDRRRGRIKRGNKNAGH